MARAAVCLAVLLLAFAVFVSASSNPLTAVQPDHATAEEASNLPVQRGKDEEEAVDKAAQAGGRRGSDATDGDLASLASPEEEGQKFESGWGKKKKLDDGEDSDSDSDSDFVSDSDSDSDDDHHSKIERKKKKHAAPGREGGSPGR